MQLYRYFVGQSSEFFSHNLCIASERMLVIDVDFVIDSVRKLLDTLVDEIPAQLIQAGRKISHRDILRLINFIQNKEELSQQ
jgi:hypothetical protein